MLIITDRTEKKQTERKGVWKKCNILAGTEILKETYVCLPLAVRQLRQWTLRNLTFPRNLTLGEANAEGWSLTEKSSRYWSQECGSMMG